ncbi:aminotransferase class I/II-fold pyridoxal phosphate-dependent enzyme [Fulvivirgaceae bacterium PWU5]|uniref:Aminotransferase class I/II-fold pyridoxal phosphate-dependent enzyme n=1 Tax=Dawidia cretensis TaxID=2782350 RepID=A0AAP2GSA1_9BACT|nr:aminotransferase class I/II-fold pyridoxal phosphate-dependent enzyme [Dawidia cretensis]MBT1707023.1 aminotransferase class I/II-fold pyridoxal phosphate-dependent enzyme [Dawidia cretensis]
MIHGKTSKITQSVHAGSHEYLAHGGVVTPIFPSSAYDYEGGRPLQYPRYFNIPNQLAVAGKVAALENAEAGVVFSSGMAAILTTLFSLLKNGDHAIFQRDLYGGTHHALAQEMPRFGIDYTLVDGAEPANFEKAIRPETRLIYIETPSNPTLKITDIQAVAAIARRHGLLTVIDNTFASPVNQNPIDLGIDIVLHSGTKYIGGHSDLCCGFAVTTQELTQRILASAINHGGSLDAHTAWLVERSLKTIVLRVRQQNENALAIARYLKTDNRIGQVYYPGLEDHPNHIVAKAQMPGGFGGMLSFEVKGDAQVFMAKLALIQRAASLGGVESTITSPARTSHVKVSAEERKATGVTDGLVRLSTGIEEAEDLINDIKQALA